MRQISTQIVCPSALYPYSCLCRLRTIVMLPCVNLIQLKVTRAENFNEAIVLGTLNEMERPTPSVVAASGSRLDKRCVRGRPFPFCSLYLSSCYRGNSLCCFCGCFLLCHQHQHFQASNLDQEWFSCKLAGFVCQIGTAEAPSVRN